MCCLHRRMDEQMDRESAAPKAAEFLLTLWNLFLLLKSLHCHTLGSNQDYTLIVFIIF